MEIRFVIRRAGVGVLRIGFLEAASVAFRFLSISASLVFSLLLRLLWAVVCFAPPPALNATARPTWTARAARGT